MSKKLSALTLLLTAWFFGVALGGTISGKVHYVGSPISQKKITVDKDDHCIKARKNILWQGLMLSSKRELQNAVISVEGVQGTFTPPDDPVIIKQHNCMFIPHVTAILAGTPIDIISYDPINHNVRTNPEENDPINYAMPEPMTLPLPDLEYPEAIKISCDIHTWMSAHLVVKENPYFDISDTSGSFRIENVPAGTHEIRVWHEELGIQNRKIEVPLSGNVTISFEYGKL